MHPIAMEGGMLRLLKNSGREGILHHRDVHCALWPDGTLAGVNEAWSTFAANNGGGAADATRYVGANLWNVVPPVLVDFYRDNHQRVLDTGLRWEHAYECSSSRLFRVMRMTVERLEAGSTVGLLVHHELRHSAPQPDIFPVYPGDTYRLRNGGIRQCAHCRKTQAAEDAGRWDWVPQWVDRLPEGVEHTLCQRCQLHHRLPPRPAVA